MSDGVLFSVLAALMFAVVIGSGVSVGSAVATNQERQKAIEAGVGRWVVDARTGERQFVYGVEGKP